jgi:hypothetical protein
MSVTVSITEKGQKTLKKLHALRRKNTEQQTTGEKQMRTKWASKSLPTYRTLNKITQKTKNAEKGNFSLVSNPMSPL